MEVKTDVGTEQRDCLVQHNLDKVDKSLVDQVTVRPVLRSLSVSKPVEQQGPDEKQLVLAAADCHHLHKVCAHFHLLEA